MIFKIPKETGLLLSIVLLGLGLRLFHLSYLPLWGDEAFTRFFSASSLSYLGTTGWHQETNPPGYYLLMHFWIALFGTSEAALRMPSALASTLAIVLVYLLGKELEGAAVGLLGALLLALAPNEIWFAQEARCYAVLHLPLALALLGLAKFLRQPDSIAALILFVLGAAGAIYCHDTALIFLVACNLAVLTAMVGKETPLSPRTLAAWIAANTVLALLILPQVWVMLTQIGSGNISYIHDLTIGRALGNLSEEIRGKAARIESLHGGGVALIVVLAATLAMRPRMQRRTVTVLILLPLFFIGLAALASLRQPLFLARIFAWLWIPLSLLLALGLTRKSVLRWVLLAATVIILTPALKSQLFPSHVLKEDWRNLLTAYRNNVPMETTLVADPSVHISSIAYYLPEAIPHLKYWQAQPDLKLTFEDQFLYQRLGTQKFTTDDLLGEIASGRPVSLITDFESRHACPAGAPPASQRFDAVVPRAYGLHILHWNSAPRGH